MANLKEFETALIKHLTAGQMDKSLLKTTSDAIVNLKKQGLHVDQILTKGTPRPDRVIINGIVDPEFWGKFKDFGHKFKTFEVFPYGIINPEGFRFKATM